MNYVIGLIFIFLLALRSETFGAVILPKNCAEKEVLNLMANWRGGMELPVPLPLLEEIKIQSFKNVYEGFGIKISYVTGDMKLRGVNNFTVQTLSVSPDYLRASITLRFPLLSLTSENYTLNGRAYILFSLTGAGFMNVTFQNVEVSVGIILVPKGKTTQVGDISLNLSIGHVKIILENSSWPVNQVLSLRGMEIVEGYRSTFIMAIKELMKYELNKVLGNTTTGNIIRTIGNNYCMNNPVSVV